jgi:hypothetical protein
MATFAELRDAIIAVLDEALPEELGVSLYAKVVDRANLPAIVVQPAEATFPFTAGAAQDEWQLDLVVMVSFGDAELAQDQLDQFLSGGGPLSIRQIFMRNKALGRNDVMAAYVAGMSDYGANFTMAGVENIGCKLRVIVATTGPTWG